MLRIIGLLVKWLWVSSHTHTHSVAQGIQLLLKKMNRKVDWVKKIFYDAKMIIDCMYRHTKILMLMHIHTKDKKLKKQCITFLNASVNTWVEDALRLMVASSEWRGMDYSKTTPPLKVTRYSVYRVLKWRQGGTICTWTICHHSSFSWWQWVHKRISISGYGKGKSNIEIGCSNGHVKYMKPWNYLIQEVMQRYFIRYMQQLLILINLSCILARLVWASRY